MTRIELEMNPAEAMRVLEAIEREGAAAFAAWTQLINTDAPAEEQAIPLAKGQMLSRVAARLSAQLYPECEWYEPCEALATERWTNGLRYCKRHIAQLAGVVAA